MIATRLNLLSVLSQQREVLAVVEAWMLRAQMVVVGLLRVLGRGLIAAADLRASAPIWIASCWARLAVEYHVKVNDVSPTGSGRAFYPTKYSTAEVCVCVLVCVDAACSVVAGARRNRA